MAAFHGKSGVVTFSGGVFEVLSWTANATADTAEATVMVGTGWKTFKAGFLDWTATVECVMPATGAVGTLETFLGSSATLTLDGGGSNPNYFGTALCTGFSPSLDANDVGKLTYTFQGVDVLAEG